MFTIEQLKQLSDFLMKDFKEVFSTKEEINKGFADMRASFSELQTAVDGIAKIAKDHPQEIKAVGDRVDNVENWIKKASSKIGLEYKS